MDRFEEGIARLLKLHRLNAPKLISAHYLFHVVIPRLCAEIGPAVCGDQFADLFTRALCEHTGTCPVCKKAPSDGDDGMCAKCRAEVDQMCEEMDRNPVELPETDDDS